MTTPQRRQQADKRLRALVRQMQAVLVARRMVHACGFSLVTAAMLDMRLRLIGVWIVGEMRRLEGQAVA